MLKKCLILTYVGNDNWKDPQIQEQRGFQSIIYFVFNNKRVYEDWLNWFKKYAKAI